MEQHITRNELLERFSEMRRELHLFLDSRTEAERAQQGTPEQWAAKDVVAQISFWMDYTVERIGYYQRGISAPREVDFNALNLRVFEENKSRAWSAVVQDVNRAWQSLTATVEQATEALLNTENVYSDGAAGPLSGEIRANGFIWPLQEIEKLYLRDHNTPRANSIHTLLNQVAPDPEHINSPLIELSALRTQQSAAVPTLIIDMRGAKEFAEGHIPGAMNIPLSDLTSRIHELPSDRPIVTYCNMHHPGQSRGEHAAALLTEKGYQASAINGGFTAWKEQGLPIDAQ